MEPTICKTPTIYDTGAGGGGINPNDIFYKNFVISAGTPDPIILGEAETNKDVCIKVNFVKRNTNAATILELLDENETRVARVQVSSSMYVSNSSGAGDNTAWGVDRNPNVVIIENSNYVVQFGASESNWSCPFAENNFKKIALAYGIIYQNIAIYKADTITGKPVNYKHNLIPYYNDNTDKGLIDLVTHIKYPYLANSKIY